MLKFNHPETQHIKGEIQMDRYQAFKEKLDRKEKIVMANLQLLQNPLLLRAFEAADCILIDKEHGIYNTENLVPLTRECRALGLPSIVRVEDTLYHLIAKAIDLGADGIMLPRTETTEQIRTAVEAMHFAPIGRTGFGGWGLFREGETLEDFQHGRFLFPQIESHKGLLEMENMIAACGEYIDGFLIGPNDYSITMGVPCRHDDPVMIREFETFFSICKKYGKSCGIYDPDLFHVQKHAGMGANIFWVGDDLGYLKAGFERFTDGIRNLE